MSVCPSVCPLTIMQNRRKRLPKRHSSCMYTDPLRTHLFARSGLFFRSSSSSFSRSIHVFMNLSMDLMRFSLMTCLLELTATAGEGGCENAIREICLSFIVMTPFKAYLSNTASSHEFSCAIKMRQQKEKKR